MALKAIYEKQDDVPEQYHELYSERNGQWELTGIEGVKTTADTDRLQTSLAKERNEHRATKDKLTAFDGVDLEAIEKTRTDLEEANIRLDAVGKDKDGNIDEENLQRLVDAKVATKLAPVERENAKLKEQVAEQGTQITGFEQADTVRTIGDAVRSAGLEAKVIDTAMEDVLMLSERMFEVGEDGIPVTKDGLNGITPGVTADVWFPEMQERRPHWWPTSQGGGAKGGGEGGGFANNPFTRDHWNLTEQGKAVSADRGKADRMATAAGTSVGGGMPPMKKAN